MVLDGFTTQDLARTQAMTREVAQVYNWWTIFAWLAVPGKHIEGTTSRTRRRLPWNGG